MSASTSQGTRLILSSELRSRLAVLLQDDLRVVVPDRVQQNVQDTLQRDESQKAGQPSEEEQLDATSEPMEKNESDSDAVEAYVSHALLADIARWARHPKSQRALWRAGLDPLDYSLIALCAGNTTYTSNAQTRLLQANPLAANPYLPPHLRIASPRESTLPFGLELRAASRELSAAANVVFSVAGVAGAVWWVSGSSAGFSKEVSVLLAILAGLVVLIAEVWLYIAQSTRAAEARRLEAEARRTEPVVGWDGGGGAVVEGLDELEKRRDRGAIESGEAEDGSGGGEEGQDDPPNLTSTEEPASKLEDDIGEMLRRIPAAEIPAADAPPANPTIRLRRRPLGEPVR